MNFLIALSENDKRILISLGILLILLFVIVGYIGLLVERIMKHQAKKAGKMMHDVVAAKVITNEKAFRKFGKKKNNRLFVKQSLIPMGILSLAFLIYIIYGAVTRNWLLKIFDYQKEGFGTILFLWDFANPDIYIEFFGMRIIGKWPPLLNTPHWESAAWASYIIVPCMFVGGIWYLVVVQAHIARTFRLRKLAKTVFNPTLDDVGPMSPLNSNMNNNGNNNNMNNPNPPNLNG
ncbi:MAG: hypothetical protein MJ214_01600 [Bacilli bacterium]|nr:hypothetical protein [Bacilli bacterium]